MMNTKLIGNIGEDMAVEYLKKQKYKIVERNVRNLCGEIDIVAVDKGVLVFVEVKYKNSLEYGYPREMVGVRKQQKIRNTALSYIKMKGLKEPEIRFDVIEILDNEITQLKAVF